MGIDAIIGPSAKRLDLSKNLAEIETPKSRTLLENKHIFKLLFPNQKWENANEKGEVQVLSPLPHSYTLNGIPEYESTPSASVNIHKGLFVDYALAPSDPLHDKAKGEGCTLIELFARVQKLPRTTIAKKLLSQALTPNVNLDLVDIQHRQRLFQTYDLRDETYLRWLQTYYIDPNVLVELGALKMGKKNELFSIPVYLFGQLVDIRSYCPNSKPKVWSVPGAKTGKIIGKQLWEQGIQNAPQSMTWICAGEKDMLAMRSLGYNAISFTGGENIRPREWMSLFKNLNVVVAYDNDEVGKLGGWEMSVLLKEAGAHVYNFTAHHYDENLKAIQGGDMWDLIHFYGNSAKQAIDWYLARTPELPQEEISKFYSKQFPKISLRESQQPQNIGQLRTSYIQVLNDVEKSYVVPTSLIGEKLQQGSTKDGNMISPGEEHLWELDLDQYTNISDVLYLFQDSVVQHKTLKSLLKIPPKEEFINIRQVEKMIVPVTTVIDYSQKAIENSRHKYDNTIVTLDTNTFSAYCLGFQLVVGKRYTIVYRLVPNPLDKQKAILLVVKATELNELNTFKLDGDTIFALQQLQLPQLEQSSDNPMKVIENKLWFHFSQDLIELERFNNIDLWLLVNLCFNTPLKIPIRKKVIRGYLDAIAIGETRSGKSLMAEHAVRKYNLGKIIDAGGATRRSLIGGTTDNGKGAVVRYGQLARENGGLVILEEIKDLAKDFFGDIRSVRSSQNLKVTRIAGDLETELQLRMLFLSNPQVPNTSNTDMRTNFNNGLEVVKSIVHSPEDLARFDIILLVDTPYNLEKNYQAVNPFTYSYADQVPNDWYQKVIRWIWTRQPNQIIWDSGIDQYLFVQSEILSQEFDRMENLYGTECEQKVARIAVALAGFLVSATPDFQNILVKKEHVDYAIRYLKKIYFNDLFRWNEQQQINKLQTIVTRQDILAMRTIMMNNGSTLLRILMSLGTDGISRTNLQASSELMSNVTKFSEFITLLKSNSLIDFDKGNIRVTAKFRQAYREVGQVKTTDVNLPTIMQEWEDAIRD